MCSPSPSARAGRAGSADDAVALTECSGPFLLRLFLILTFFFAALCLGSFVLTRDGRSLDRELGLLEGDVRGQIDAATAEITKCEEAVDGNGGEVAREQIRSVRDRLRVYWQRVVAAIAAQDVRGITSERKDLQAWLQRAEEADVPKLPSQELKSQVTKAIGAARTYCLR
jgi:hypothetical protein